MFISIDIGPLKSLITIGKNLKKINPYLKVVNPQNIHFTLKFLGDTEIKKISAIKEAIKKSVEGIPPFSLNLKGVGVFPNFNYIRVIWVGLEPMNAHKDLLFDITRKIDEELYNLGFCKNKQFKPHVTLARVKNITNKSVLKQFIEKYSTHNFDTKKIDSITLKKSELTPKGPIYETLETIKI
jgi:2'-5' RNA ligase